MKPEDLIVLILACAMSLGLVLSVIMPYLFKVPLTDAQLKAREVVLSAILAIISLYIGSKLHPGTPPTAQKGPGNETELRHSDNGTQVDRARP